jgi:ribosomal protein S4
MSWNKYNLHNLQRSGWLAGRLSDKNLSERRLFAIQQVSKRYTRKYHGQELPERVFKKQLYSPRFNVVAGGEQGSRRLIWGGFYQNVERRLDTVIFRSLFATSIRQARQLVVHGHVELNGKIVFYY